MVQEGQAVEVRVEAVDRANKKLSLSLAEISRAEEEAAAELKAYQEKDAVPPENLGTMADILKAKLERKE